MRILAIDSATEACSAALLLIPEGASERGAEVRERYELAPRQHANLLLMMVDQLLAEAGLRLNQLDALAFGRGPGGFTGVRIATGVVQGLGFGADLPVVPVSTLQALAHGAWREAGHVRVLAAIDARMDEVYWGAYVHEGGHDGQAMVCRGGEHVGSPHSVVAATEDGVEAPWFGVGTGWGVHGAAMQASLTVAGQSVGGSDVARYPRAHDIALLGARGLERGEGVPAEQALPVYLRDTVARKRSAGL